MSEANRLELEQFRRVAAVAPNNGGAGNAPSYDDLVNVDDKQLLTPAQYNMRIEAAEKNSLKNKLGDEEFEKRVAAAEERSRELARHTEQYQLWRVRREKRAAEYSLDDFAAREGAEAAEVARAQTLLPAVNRERPAPTRDVDEAAKSRIHAVVLQR